MFPEVTTGSAGDTHTGGYKCRLSLDIFVVTIADAIAIAAIGIVPECVVMSINVVAALERELFLDAAG
jgi:hypothetical protein